MSPRRHRRPGRLAAVLAAGLAAAATATTASGAVVQKLDLETGSFSQWSEVQSACTGGGYDAAGVGNSCASVVSSPKREGAYAARYRISPWTSGTSTSPRAEAYIARSETGSFDGQEWYYAWSTMFPSAENTGWWTKGGDWNYFTQMHGTGPVGTLFAFGIDARSGTPMVFFEHLTKAAGDVTTDVAIAKTVLGPLRYDSWYDFVMRVRWSPTAGKGLVEVWVDGTKWLTQAGATLPPGGHGAYLKQGYYGGAHGGSNVVYHDGTRRAAQLADVLSGAATPTPAPQPAPAPAPAPAPPVVLEPAPTTPPVTLEPPKKPKPKPRVRAESRAKPGPVLRWEGRTYRSARQLRASLGARGVRWEPFLHRYPGIVRTFKLEPVHWRGKLYYSRPALERRLTASGTTYRSFASRYPARARRLDRNATR